jgi:hypothetical protein
MQHARFEGRGPTRDGRGSRRDGADAVAVVASAGLRACRSAFREVAGLIEEHATQHARFEGRDPTRDGRGARRDGADAVARLASALEHAVGLEQSAVATVASGATARSRCSHLPSFLPGAFAITSSRAVNDVCSLTVLGDLAPCVHCIRRRRLSGRCVALTARSRASSRSTQALGHVVQLAVHIVRRKLAGLIEEHAKQHARFEGRSSTRDGRGSRCDGVDAVAVVASALDHAVGLEQSAVETIASGPIGRSRCSHLPSVLPGAFAITSSRAVNDVCSLTVLGGLARPRALHRASQALGPLCRAHRELASAAGLIEAREPRAPSAARRSSNSAVRLAGRRHGAQDELSDHSMAVSAIAARPSHTPQSRSAASLAPASRTTERESTSDPRPQRRATREHNAASAPSRMPRLRVVKLVCAARNRASDETVAAVSATVPARRARRPGNCAASATSGSSRATSTCSHASSARRDAGRRALLPRRDRW